MFGSLLMYSRILAFNRVYGTWKKDIGYKMFGYNTYRLHKMSATKHFGELSTKHFGYIMHWLQNVWATKCISYKMYRLQNDWL